METTPTKKPGIALLSLGGTLVSTAIRTTDPFYGRPSLDISHVLASLPAMEELATLQHETLVNVTSQEITHDVLLSLGKRIQQLVADPHVDGIVVTQGTNTLEEVAYFVHLIAQTEKPIVFTGAMRPANAIGQDGTRNLYNAIRLASSAEAAGKGVLITFNDSIISARDAAKLNATGTANFLGNTFAALGYLHGGRPYFQRTPLKRHTSRSEFCVNTLTHFPRVCILYGHLGIDPAFVRGFIKQGIQGIVSAGMGEGYQPLTTTHALADAAKQGITVVRCARTGQGTVHYDAHTDETYGFVPGDSLTPQKAYILLSIALNKTKQRHDLQRIFSEY